MQEHIVIIGNGISGVTLARCVRKLSNKKITIISSENDYFFSRTALMYVFMGHLKFEHTQPYENFFWKKNKIELVNDYVNKIEVSQNQLVLKSNKTLKYDKLIIATGSKPNKLNLENETCNGVVNLYHKQDLDTIEILAKTAKNAVLIGGGLIGVELAEMLHSKNIDVTYLIRENSFWNSVLPNEESQMITNHILENKIKIVPNASISSINIDNNANLKSITTNLNVEIPCNILGVTIGVSPNISFLKNSEIETEKGVLVNEFLQTNIKNIYAIGDCAQQKTIQGNRKSVEAVWYTGKIMGETLAKTICGFPTQYNPGNWFNSAKFFDIEYQTYGWVFAKKLPFEKQLYWQQKNKAIRIAFNAQTNEFLGINTFGIRLKQEFFDQVLNEKKSVDFVIENIHQANFDPEFYKNYFPEIKKTLNNQLNLSETI